MVLARKLLASDFDSFVQEILRFFVSPLGYIKTGPAYRGIAGLFFMHIED
jgi:hypothetical protein